nr:fumarylacetoacetate hydrolase [Comamonas composti]
MKLTLKPGLLGALIVTCATGAQAACLDQAQISAWVQGYVAQQPVSNPPADLSDADGACTRARFTAALEKQGAKIIGYKAGLTNPAVQKRFSTDKPVWGKLYEGMLRPDGARMPAKFGARPLFEADMLVRIKSAGIASAATPQQVLENIDQVVPFIELPDLMVEAPPKLNGAGVAAINVGARLGVMGKPLAVPRDSALRSALLDGLRSMQVVVRDGEQEVVRGKGSDILEHPLNAVSWLARALASEGLALQPGDWVSLGSFSPLMPAKPGQAISVSYEGLQGLEPVHVSFE